MEGRGRLGGGEWVEEESRGKWGVGGSGGEEKGSEVGDRAWEVKRETR